MRFGVSRLPYDDSGAKPLESMLSTAVKLLLTY